mgnify:FL=1
MTVLPIRQPSENDAAAAVPVAPAKARDKIKTVDGLAEIAKVLRQI